jgi:dihydroorotate dehydrogenase
LRALQEHDALTVLLETIQRENRDASKPVLVKIAPDLAIEDLEQVIATCERSGIAGLIATNTTVDHSSIPSALDQTGGLSGRPVREKSTAFVRAIKERSRLPIIGVGGIMDADTAREKFEAGAVLVQLYTGFIYRGPGLLREIAAAR